MTRIELSGVAGEAARAGAAATPTAIASHNIAASAHPSPEQPRHLGEVHRLHQVRVEAGLARAATVMLLAPAGHGDERHALPARLLPDPARHVVAVERRQ